LSVTIFDRTLQELVDKLLPELNETDQIEEVKYYRRKGILPKKEFAEEIDREEKMLLKKGIEDEDLHDGDTKGKGKMKVHNSPGHRFMLRRQIYELSCDELNVELKMEESDRGKLLPGKAVSEDLTTEKDNSIQLLQNSYIRTSGRLKICQLKKYILSQLKMESKFLSKLAIMCKGDPVDDDFSLAFIQKTMWLVPDEEMILSYCFKK
jgi:hypothetical protein